MNRIERYLQKTPKEKRSSAAIAYLASLDCIEQTSPTIADEISKELEDQRSYLKLIASENYSSLAVQLAMGNLLTDKYAEGFPFHRFYAGCDRVDNIEAEAAELARTLFGADHAFVQPHCGADANLIAQWAIILTRVQSKEVEKLGKKSIDELTKEEYETVRKALVNQKLMGMSLNSGGHLTHGYRHNISSKMMQAVHYDVDPKTELLDYKVIAEQAKKEKPLILLAGYSAHSRKINFAKMREIADSVGAVLMVDMAHFAGLVAGKVFTGEFDPIPYAHIATSTTHKTLRGPRGGLIVCKEEFKEGIDRACPMAMGGPLPHVMAAKAIAFREANTKEFQNYAHKVVENAKYLGECLKARGVRLISGGTENHLLILDVSPYGLNGRQVEIALRRAHITVNRNTVPNDKNGPWYTSGIRIGTPATTTLKMGKPEMKVIADTIATILENTKPALPDSKGGKGHLAKSLTDQGILEKAISDIQDILDNYPLYPEIEGTARKTLENPITETVL